MHRSGFVNIIGNPNVGKSTLMNALVGEKLSIITSKAQTTRHRIMGIVSGEDFQIVYSDTPGILKPSYKLQESMMKFVTGAVTDADVILYVTDTVEQGDALRGKVLYLNREDVRLEEGQVFLQENVRRIRRLIWDCGAVSLISLACTWLYPPLLFVTLIMAFLCLVVAVVSNIMAAATRLREENDLTI